MGCFSFGAIMDNAAVNIVYSTCFCVKVFSVFSGVYLGVYLVTLRLIFCRLLSDLQGAHVNTRQWFHFILFSSSCLLHGFLTWWGGPLWNDCYLQLDFGKAMEDTVGCPPRISLAPSLLPSLLTSKRPLSGGQNLKCV